MRRAQTQRRRLKAGIKRPRSPQPSMDLVIFDLDGTLIDSSRDWRIP